MSDFKSAAPFLLATAGLLACIAAAGCGSSSGGAVSPALSEVGLSPSQQFRELELSGRPPTLLIARHGDPAGAFAIAFAAPDESPVPPAIVVRLVATRLQAAGFGLFSASALPRGGYISVLTRTAADAKRAIETMDAALSDVVTGKEPWFDSLTSRDGVAVGAAQPGCWAGAPPKPVASVPAKTPAIAGVKQLNEWRAAVRQASRVRFAAVGGREHLDAVEDAIESLESWPTGSLPSPSWPEKDSFSVAPASGGPDLLAISVRLPTASAAVEAAGVLGKPTSALALQLAGTGRGWRLEAVSGEAELTGGCLHLRLQPASTSAEPSPTEVARAAYLAVDEVHRAADHEVDARWATAASILRSEDPRRAAAAAAWRALSKPIDEPIRTRITWYSGAEVEPSGDALVHAYDGFDAAWKAPRLEAAVREEPGQGELWVLLATPCGTGVEGRYDAGLGALAWSTVARASNGIDGVVLEPWVAADGLGLVAHAARQADSETLDDLAARVAQALGRALLRRESAAGAFLDAKRAGLALLGPHPRPGYWTMLDALSPQHPSWLLPEGTWDALAGADWGRAGARLRMMLSGPLRVATLANGGAQQSEVVTTTLARWLRPFRAEPRSCPASDAPPPPQWGLTRLDAAGGAERATSYVGVTLPTYNAPLDSEARYTAWLLDRRGGWVERALTRSHLASSAKTHLFGGPKAAAIVVELAAQAEQRHAAVMQVRALFGRLESGAASDADVAAARRYFGEAELLAALDPRYRVVDLWRRHEGTGAGLTALDLRRFHRQVFAPDRVVVVELADEP